MYIFNLRKKQNKTKTKTKNKNKNKTKNKNHTHKQVNKQTNNRVVDNNAVSKI